MPRNYPMGYAHEHGLGPEEEETEEVRPAPTLAEIRAHFARIDAVRRAASAYVDALQGLAPLRLCIQRAAA